MGILDIREKKELLERKDHRAHRGSLEQGSIGAPRIRGETGAKGRQGQKGSLGLKGNKGIRGLVGIQGPKGECVVPPKIIVYPVSH